MQSGAELGQDPVPPVAGGQGACRVDAPGCSLSKSKLGRDSFRPGVPWGRGVQSGRQATLQTGSRSPRSTPLAGAKVGRGVDVDALGRPLSKPGPDS